MAARPGSSIGQKLAVVGASGLLALGGFGIASAYRAAHPGRSEFCTLAASIGGREFDTPEAAFDDWWDESHPDGPTQAEADVHRDGNVWHIDRGEPGWRKVDVDHPFGSDGRRETSGRAWTVVADNSCHA